MADTPRRVLTKADESGQRRMSKKRTRHGVSLHMRECCALHFLRVFCCAFAEICDGDVYAE